VIHPQDRPVWDEALLRRRAGETTLDEYRLVWPDGSVRCIQDQARAVPETGDGCIRLYGVFTDVTARKPSAAAAPLLGISDHGQEGRLSASPGL
jgi:PAS domain-containing protein